MIILATEGDHSTRRYLIGFMIALAAGACAPRAHVAAPAAPACRAAVTPEGAAAHVDWAVAAPRDRSTLDDWCRIVGPAVVRTEARRRAAPPRLDEMAVVTWNVDVGGGDVDALLDSVIDPAQADRAVVLLLQETYRSGDLVPPTDAAREVPRRIDHAPKATARRSAIDVARSRGWSLAYVPSMRNGRAKGALAEDRGNAILSNLPLANVEAIELPFEHQRRVAIAATVSVRDGADRIVPLRVVTAHLDARAAWRHGLVFWAGRSRQADALAGAIDRAGAATIVGGDFNSWLGGLEPEVRALGRRFPQTPPDRAHVTFPIVGRLGFHLDHLFLRLPEGAAASVSRLDDRFGSDHYPLLASISWRGQARTGPNDRAR